MKKEFVPYEHALALKELGFDEPCMRGWDKDGGIWYHPDSDIILDNPTFSQAFRWFREKYNLHHSISILQRSCRYHFKIRTIECESDLKPFGDNKIIFEDGPRKKYEDIELDCLKKLIEIVTNKN